MQDLPDELLEIVILKAGVGVAAVCRRFMALVMANVARATIVSPLTRCLPKLMTLDVSGASADFPIDAVENMTVTWEQLPNIRNRDRVARLNVVGHSYRAVDGMLDFVNARHVTAFVTTDETFECLALPWLETLDLECDGDCTSAQVVMPLLPRTLKALRLAGCIDTYAAGEPLELRHLPLGLEKLEYVVDCYPGRLVRSAEEFSRLYQLTSLVSVAVPAGTPVSVIPESVRDKVSNSVAAGPYRVANSVYDGFYEAAANAACHRRLYSKANSSSISTFIEARSSKQSS